MARVKGVKFLPYLFTEGVSSPHLHAHYSPSMSHHECFIRWGSDPIFGEKNGNGPRGTFMAISFYGGPLAKNGFWDICRASYPLCENKGGVSSDPLFSLKNGFLWGSWRSCSWGERGLIFPARCGSVDCWKWWERAEGHFFRCRWQMSHPLVHVPHPPALVRMTNVIIFSCEMIIEFPWWTMPHYRAHCVNCPSQKGQRRQLGHARRQRRGLRAS